MSLKYFWEKIKESRGEIYLSITIVLIGFLGFGLGRLSKIEDNKLPIMIRNLNSDNYQPGLPAKINTKNSGQYLASKTGTVYYLPWCSGASKIKESNKIWFENKEEAEVTGYKKAVNCKGI